LDAPLNIYDNGSERGQFLRAGHREAVVSRIRHRKKEPEVKPPQPDVQPDRTPREIPQDKDILEKEMPPMQLAPPRGDNW